MKNSQVVIPGLYDPKKTQIYISGFYDALELIISKRKPRRIKIFGSDGKTYDFLLKGHEDLRQDERVMQSLSLVNTLLKKNDKTEKQNLAIVTYPVIPLSTDTGLLGWVQNCDTLQQLIKDYRHANQVIKDCERNIMHNLCPNFQIVCVPHKVEVFRYIIESTKAEDLKKVLWLKSENAEVWLEKRTNYVRSLATMSMVGYILGLGDRHLSNLMMQRMSGKIVHIDFGDLFEVTMTREKHPEKVPFRLTRVLMKAMEACGIEGNYRATCENVMEVLRENKDSLMAILEAFVTDPLLNWRLITTELINNNAADLQFAGNKQSFKQQINIPDVAQSHPDHAAEPQHELDGRETRDRVQAEPGREPDVPRGRHPQQESPGGRQPDQSQAPGERLQEPDPPAGQRPGGPAHPASHFSRERLPGVARLEPFPLTNVQVSPDEDVSISCRHGVVVSTLASHASSRGFDPHCLYLFLLFVQKKSRRRALSQYKYLVVVV